MLCVASSSVTCSVLLSASFISSVFPDQMSSLLCKLLVATLAASSLGSRGWGDSWEDGPRRFPNNYQVQRVRRQQEQRPMGQRLLPNFGGGLRRKGPAPKGTRPVLEKRQGPASGFQNRQFKKVPVNQEQIRIRPTPEAAPVAEKRIIQSYEPEFQDFEQNQFNKYQSEPEPVRQSQQQQGYQRKSPARPQVADKRQDNDLSESAPVPHHQTDLEASVQAAAAGYQGEAYNQPQKVSFQIHGQGGPHSYRFGYDTGVGYNRQFRYEERDANGVLHGRYGYYDQEGKLQIVNYTADPVAGFHAEGDHVPKPQY